MAWSWVQVRLGVVVWPLVLVQDEQSNWRPQSYALLDP